MNNILKAIQPKPHEQWNGNLDHRKTIQSQKQRIDELEKEIDFEILHRTIAQEELRRMADEFEIVANKLVTKEELFRISQEELKLMDEKLLDAQDQFFNLGDACMNRIVGLESPFQYE